MISNLISIFLPRSDMFIAAGEFVKAAEILGENGWTEKYVSFIILICLSVYTTILLENKYLI